MLPINQVLCSDALSALSNLRDESIHCAITSPPYWSQRQYSAGDLEIGIEQTPQQYVDALVEVFHELKRVLRSDGTFWLNIGDVYSGSGKATGRTWENGAIPNMSSKQASNSGSLVDQRTTVQGLADKNLLLLPARVALGLQADGWIVRQNICWSIPNRMPESVQDRCTTGFETVFHLVKSGSYFYDAYAIAEPALNGDTSFPNGSYGTRPNKRRRMTGGDFSKRYADAQPEHGGESHRKAYTLRNKRSVWTIPTQPLHAEHTASFPEALVEICLLAGCPPLVCALCNTPYERILKKEGGNWDERKAAGAPARYGVNAAKGTAQDRMGEVELESLGFAKQCLCETNDTVAGIVIDPFIGSGTTGVVAEKLRRRWIGIELSPVFAEMATMRIAGRLKEYTDRVKGNPFTEYMF